MSFLKPIDKEIQKRLFQKMKALGRRDKTTSPNQPVANQNDLTYDKIATRSTFIRMTSGLEEPVVLMAGELLPDGTVTDANGDISIGGGNFSKMAGGYDDIYGARPYFADDDIFNQNQLGQNKFRRPMPGIKSVDAQFLGGAKALRRATVNWTCWSFEDIDRLTPHFLSVGKTVLVEWGWVYGNDGLRNVRGFIGADGIRKSAYENYREVINGMKGDIDMMVGIVNNFEFNTRSDGGFDCTTTITSVGSDMLKNPAPAKGSTNLTVRLDAKKDITAEDLQKKLSSDSNDKNPPEVTLKNMISEIDEFLLDQITKFDNKGRADGYIDGTPELDYSGIGRYRYVRNSFLIDSNSSGSPPTDVWVRWGWFEDNILSKFTTIIGGTVTKSQIRSVDNVLDERTKRVIGYTPTLIRDDEDFETTNPFKFILPGKFKPLDKNAVSEKFKKEVGTNLINKKYGDKTKLVELAAVVNEDNNFQPFNAAKVRGTDIRRPDRGVFRNILINTKLLKEAMGILEGPSIESFSTFEFLTRMFDLLNEDIGFWNYEIQADENQTYRLKIVDTFAVDKDILEEKPNRPKAGNTTTRTAYDDDTGEIVGGTAGVFYFPVWQHDSLVKDQNMSCTIPNEIAISVMYGANAPKINTAGATENEANDEAAQAAGGSGKSAGDGGDLKNLSIVLHKDGFENYGVDSRVEVTNPLLGIGPTQRFPEYENGLSKKGFKFVRSIKDFFNTDAVKTRTSDRKKERQKKKDEKISAAVDGRLNSSLDEQISSALPPPLFDRLEPEQRLEVFKNVEFKGVDIKEQEVFNVKPISNFAELYFTKFDSEGRMKQPFIDSIVYNLTYRTKTKSRKKVKKSNTDLEKPLLLPISLELSIDGIGGIFPFESFHSTYLPKRYQEEAIFQIFEVNHTIDSSQWTTTISGKMRSNLKTIYKTEIVDNDVKEILDQFHAAQAASFAEETKEAIFAQDKDGDRRKTKLAQNRQAEFEETFRQEDLKKKQEAEQQASGANNG